ncbi:MAG: DUF5615 family PIN-like protein [Planctomycetes bacterium]|nr:DUF5615 family PIN-like protein [Planctomycetota bacterium]
MPPPPFARLALDEDVHARLARALRARGHDVVALVEEDRLGCSDEENLRWAARVDRTIVTFDVSDFATLHDSFLRRGEPHAGILLSVQLPIGELKERLLRFLRRWSAEDLRNQLLWLGRIP